ncbi:hypothetical protein BD626DRAFT_568373 [Schizophyllum amplum]|uniref:Uncharacterized protein n=1 Tax=Schizophyllum amplum TaxID=97359 RepID=A0A550CG16_9AGAR|nr:hypothetical protein BD626DRAFT_568373 [Auriculariopsis ampla]
MEDGLEVVAEKVLAEDSVEGGYTVLADGYIVLADDARYLPDCPALSKPDDSENSSDELNTEGQLLDDEDVESSLNESRSSPNESNTSSNESRSSLNDSRSSSAERYPTPNDSGCSSSVDSGCENVRGVVRDAEPVVRSAELLHPSYGFDDGQTRIRDPGVFGGRPKGRVAQRT